MSASTTAPTLADHGQSLVLGQMEWGQYVTISDAFVDRANLRVIYIDHVLTFLTSGRSHHCCVSHLSDLIRAIASTFALPWETAGRATFRRADLEVGVEGDQTFYFGEHAEIMKGSRDIDLTTQPPPDLAIEVETTLPADSAVLAWGRIGVPEVWRSDAHVVSFWRRLKDGTYAPIERSLAFPVLTPADVVEQMQRAEALGASRWYAQLGDWVREAIFPRLLG